MSGAPSPSREDTGTRSADRRTDAMPIDFEQLITRSPNPYVVLDRDLTLVWMNDAYLRTTTRSREEITGKRMFEAFPSDPASESFRLLESSLQRVLKTGQPDELALIRYDIRRADGSMEERYWSATHQPLLDEMGEPAYILQHTVDVTELHRLRALRDEMGVMQRAEAVQARNRDLTEESQRLRALFEQAPGFIAVLSGSDHRFVLANQAYSSLIGGRHVVGKTVAEALPEVVDQGFVELLDRVSASGQAYVGSREKVRLSKEPGGPVDDRFLDFIYQPIFDHDGRVSGVFVQGHDVTEQVEAEERQKLLINELNHRVKNTLAIVQGLAMQSFRRIANSEDAQRTFSSRLNALAAAHTLLTDRSWEAAGLEDTLRRSVEATAGQDTDRVHFHGPDATLRPQLAVAVAMIVHELSTNAIKYGALSQDSGMVEVTWTIPQAEDRRLVRIEWIESGGPSVEKPGRQGFGTRLIQRGLAGEKGSSVVMDFAPEGLRCTITLDISLTE